MIETLKTVAVCLSASIATLALIYFAIKEIIALVKKGAVKRHERALARDEKKRIEEEKEYAYKLYLKQKAEIKKELK